ncbi:hypothetical protein RB195_016208 [Necator americanus]|uniref:Uncharacterized protein n=1 Tax=Necator americanus TaxID=51031 RepID=A0ABR1E818_NECAM
MQEESEVCIVHHLTREQSESLQFKDESMKLGTLLTLLLIITAVSVEAGFGSRLRKVLKRIGRPFGLQKLKDLKNLDNILFGGGRRGVKKGAEIAAAGVAGKAILSVAAGRRKRYDYGKYVSMNSKPLFVEELGRLSLTVPPIHFKSAIDS